MLKTRLLRIRHLPWEQERGLGCHLALDLAKEQGRDWVRRPHPAYGMVLAWAMHAEPDLVSA